MAFGSMLLPDALRLDASAIATLQSAASGGHQYLVLLSHMRSYSSVLAHVLGSSPQIQGYGETQVRFRNVFDVWRFRRSIERSTGRPLKGPWLLDKVLHNDIRPVDRFVGRDRVRPLIFLRRPERTLQSLIALARSQRSVSAYADAQVGCDYYVRRLHRLREDGERYGRQALYFDAEALVSQPQALLQSLSHWLDLAQPLAPEYRLGRQSGRAGFGDSSPNIRAGTVLGQERSTTHGTGAAIDPAVLAEAQAAYARCRAALVRHCSTLPSGLVG
jgi:hypothetical protein